MTPSGAPSDRTTVRRLPQRAVYDRAEIDKILDEGLICHVGIIDAGAPCVIPVTYARIGDNLFVHGSRASRLLRTLAGGTEACVTVTLVDGLVLARSAFHHSMNYRSVVAFGMGRAVEDRAEKLAVFEQLMERLTPGRWAEIRQPNEQELLQTLVVDISIREASAKVRTGPPKDDEEDLALGIWAGVLPLRLEASPPIPDPLLAPGTSIPAHLVGFQPISSRSD